MSEVTIIALGGTDSSGGAGLTRDAAAAAQLGVKVRPVVTAVTVQTDDTLKRAQYMSKAMVIDQLCAALEDKSARAIKIGMLGASDVVKAVAEILNATALPIILDPVLQSSSGGDLQQGGALAPILPLVTLLTPNLNEAAQLSARPLAQSIQDIECQAQCLRGLGATNVLMKGGHGGGPVCEDRLYHDGDTRVFQSRRQPHGRRGTGCTLATAIACNMAMSDPLPEACAKAHVFVRDWIAQAQQSN